MSMRFIDGFDWTTSTVDGSKKWDSNYNGLSAAGGGAYSLGKYATFFGAIKTFTAHYVGAFQGFHVFIGGGYSANTLCEWRDAGTLQCDLRMDASGHLFFTRNGTTIGTDGNGAGVSTQQLTLNAWNWIEAKIVIDPSAGEASLKVANSLGYLAWLTQTGLNTRNTANSYLTQIRMSPTLGTLPFDNYHFWDTVDSGDGIVDWYGEHIIDSELATADGSNAAWTPNSGSNGFSRINETTPDSDTTYLSSAVSGNISSFIVHDVVPTSGNVDAIAINTLDRLESVSTFTLQHYLKSPATSGSPATGAAFGPSPNYLNHQTIFAGANADPNGSIAFTVASRNAAEFGFKQVT